MSRNSRGDAAVRTTNRVIFNKLFSLLICYCHRARLEIIDFEENRSHVKYSSKCCVKNVGKCVKFSQVGSARCLNKPTLNCVQNKAVSRSKLKISVTIEKFKKQASHQLAKRLKTLLWRKRIYNWTGMIPMGRKSAWVSKWIANWINQLGFGCFFWSAKFAVSFCIVAGKLFRLPFEVEGCIRRPKPTRRLA